MQSRINERPAPHRADRPLVIALGVVGFSEKIINGGVVQAGEQNENVGGKIVIAGFVLAVARLGYVKVLRNIGLCEVKVFTEIT